MRMSEPFPLSVSLLPPHSTGANPRLKLVMARPQVRPARQRERSLVHPPAEILHDVSEIQMSDAHETFQQCDRHARIIRP